MANIAFIGLGAMGLPMAQNLIAVGHSVTGYDTRSLQMSRLASAGARAVDAAAFAVRDADFVITCLPDIQSLRAVYVDSSEVLKAAKRSAILIDCSTVGIDETRMLVSTVEASGLTMLDAPVIGDPADVKARMLSFVVGGSLAAFAEAKPVLSDIGERVIHVGKTGMGQAAALCTNLMTIVNLIGAAEAFALSERLGLAAEKLFEVAAMSTASSWSLIDRCPQSGLVPEAPSNNLYQGGFPAERALKQLKLLETSGGKVDARTPLTSQAVDLFAEYCDVRDPRLDFSAIIQILRRR